jgi:hypothetical protein
VAVPDSVPRPPAVYDDWPPSAHQLDGGAGPDAGARPDQPAQPARLRPGRILATALAAVLYALGWAAGAVLVPVLTGCAWLCSAIALGWSDAADMWRRSGGA